MIVINDKLIVGSSFDEHNAEVGAILNVAKDLLPTRDWSNGVEYIHIGLVDGPGNRIGYYYAAVMALSWLLRDGHKVLVCCHDGASRSMAVVAMYLNLNLITGMGWDSVLSMILDHREDCIPEPHPEHKKAFEKVDWKLLKQVVNSGE